ncbi:MAG: spore coat protein U domain-containing protein [Bryobacteraceae bacterium]
MKRLITAFIALTAFANLATAATCTVSTSGVAFGSYDPVAGGARDSSGIIAVSCTGTANEALSFILTATAGNGSYSSRHATSATINAAYNLYTDNSRASVWGDGTSNTSVISDSVNLDTNGNLTRSYTVYGSIPASQTAVRAGTYSDQMVITLTY